MKYKTIPANAEIGRCINTGITFSLVNKEETCLADLVDPIRVKEAAESGQEKHNRLSNRMADLLSAYKDIEVQSSKATNDFHESASLSSSKVADRSNQLIEEVEVLSRKMDADCETMWKLTDTPKSLMQASKTAYLHDNTFIASLMQTSEEVNSLYAEVVELRNQITQTSLQHLQQISAVESSISSIHLTLAQLDIDEDSARIFEVLNAAVRLPFIYGSILIEYVKRNEWAEKMTADSSSIAEEMATYKTEEAKRRQKWAKDFGTAIDLSSLNEMTLGIEVNLQSQKESWPKVTRRDVDEYLAYLESSDGFKDVVEELKELVKSLDAVPKHQAKRAKAFKNGSLHEATFGSNSLLLRGDDDTLRSLRKDKLRAEERLKSAESRIRKLEDLLHRQSQSSRPSSISGLGISGAPSFERFASSPAPNFSSALSRARETEPSQVTGSFRRLSVNQDSESKSLAQRIVSLEAELMTQKAQSKELERASAARTNAEDMLKEQIREVISTKEDLLSNFEAQQREFDDERRLLNENNKKLKVRLEELEDELDRFYSSQDHEYKIQALEEDLDAARKEAASEVQNAHEQAAAARNESLAHRQKVEQLEQDLQALSGEKQNIQAAALEYSQQLKRRDRTDTDYQSVLLSALLRISQDATPPDDFGVLIHTLGTAVESCMSQQMTLEKTMQAVKSDNGALDARLRSQSDKNEELQGRIQRAEDDSRSLRDQLQQEATRYDALQHEHQSSQDELKSLQGRFDAGQVEAKSLRELIEEKEGLVGGSQDKVEKAERHADELSSKLEQKRFELASLQGSYVRLNSNRELQASRIDDISGRLFQQTTKLQRLLEQLGFSITRQDGNMLIQRASRTTSGSTTLIDPSASMKRSISGQILTKEEAESTIDPKVLHWAKEENLDDMAGLYDDYFRTVSGFDTDAFHEALYKRVKEIEHVARKSQRDARAYRDKAHRAQGEAHERLAIRAFKEGDLALFLPTRDQATKPWAAFNVGAPHYFLREQESHRLSKRDWLIARISKVEERIVDLSKSMNGTKGTKDEDTSPDDENPYELSDGLRWYLLDAAEEKPGAPINVGLGKTTVASVNVDAKGTVRIKRSPDSNGATKTLTRSLDSRRSSANSKKGLVAVTSNSIANQTASETIADQADSDVKSTQTIQKDDRRNSAPEAQDLPQSPGKDNEQVGTTNIPSSLPESLPHTQTRDSSEAMGTGQGLI